MHGFHKFLLSIVNHYSRHPVLLQVGFRYAHLANESPEIVQSLSIIVVKLMKITWEGITVQAIMGLRKKEYHNNCSYSGRSCIF